VLSAEKRGITVKTRSKLSEAKHVALRITPVVTISWQGSLSLFVLTHLRKKEKKMQMPATRPKLKAVTPK